jgi:hypothetical protein
MHKMNRTVVFHIGPAKTGTTTIQKYLRTHASQLLEAGVLYPRFGRYASGEEYKIIFRNRTMKVKGPMDPHHKLVWVLQGKHPELEGGTLLSSILSEIEESGANTVFISSESFPSLSVEQVKQLADAFSGYRVKVLFYNRNIEKWLISVYNQDVKMGRTFQALDGFIQEERIVPFTEMLAPWEEVFGAENLIIRDFDAAVKGGHLIDDLSQVLGVNYENKTEGKEAENASLGRNVTNGLLYFNKLELTGMLGFIPSSLRYVFRNKVMQPGTWQHQLVSFAGRLLPLKNSKSVEEFAAHFKEGWYDSYRRKYLSVMKSYNY